MSARDHCTAWFEGWFGSSWAHCCAAHDLAYAQVQAGGVDRALADAALHACVAETGHPVMAYVMLVGVTLFGGLTLALKRWWRARRA